MAAAVGLLSLLICIALIILFVSMIPLPGERLACDACVGAGMIGIVIASAGIGLVGGMTAIVLGFVSRSRDRGERDPGDLAIILGVTAVVATPAVYIFMMIANA